MVSEQVETQDGTVVAVKEQGIAPIADYLKEHGVRVYFSTEAGDETFRLPMIWFDGDEDEGLRAVDVVKEFAKHRGYVLCQLRREWIYVSLPDGIPHSPTKPQWIMTFRSPNNVPVYLDTSVR